MHKIYDRWPARTSHSANAVYRVTHTGGTSEVTVNQKLDGTEWNLLGTFSLNSANSKVTLLPQADGTVAADAVKAVKTDEASRIFYVHADHLNASRVVLDHQNRLRWRWLSDPFGQLPPEDNPSGLGAFELNLRLPGQVFDRESNLHYNYFRDYDPASGRYVQSDPIGLEGGVNTYAYVGGNPLSLVDSLGLNAAAPAIPYPGTGVGTGIGTGLGGLLGWCGRLLGPLGLLLTPSSTSPCDTIDKPSICAMDREAAYAQCVHDCTQKANIENERCAINHRNDPSGYRQCAAGVLARLEICVVGCAAKYGF